MTARFLPVSTLTPIILAGCFALATPGISLASGGTDPMPGDANGDGTVDLGDLEILDENFDVTEDPVHGDGNFNSDENVDLLDLDILGQNWGSTANPTPEPSSALLAMIALGWGAARRSR